MFFVLKKIINLEGVKHLYEFVTSSIVYFYNGVIQYSFVFVCVLKVVALEKYRI